MDSRWFEDALVLLEERNMTRAAHRRNITQPAFSRRIRSLENWLGISLLDRKANSIELNPSLLASEEQIRSLLANMHELRNRLRTFTPAQSELYIATQHALTFSAFPDFAALAKRQFPNLSFRLRSGNKNDCVSWFMRRDVSVLLCYKSEQSKPMPFDKAITRDQWGTDRLLPVVGGDLRDSSMSDQLPSIVYPEDSYFGKILTREACRFSTRALSPDPICETAFSAGIKDLVSKGLGIAWLPWSMVGTEIGAGKLTDLSAQYGSVELQIIIYADSQDRLSKQLRDIWLANSSA